MVYKAQTHSLVSSHFCGVHPSFAHLLLPGPFTSCNAVEGNCTLRVGKTIHRDVERRKYNFNLFLKAFLINMFSLCVLMGYDVICHHMHTACSDQIRVISLLIVCSCSEALSCFLLDLCEVCDRSWWTLAIPLRCGAGAHTELFWCPSSSFLCSLLPALLRL